MSSRAAEPLLSVSPPASGPTTAVALVLHGGREHSHGRVRATNLALLRMRPFVSSLRRAGKDHGLAVASLRYLVRGWNNDEQSPVHDAAWALARLGERFPDVPVALVGHSMGGRTALHAAAHPSVTSIAALAPWIEPGDPTDRVDGRRLMIVHGDRDRITDPSASAALADTVRGRAASVGYVRLRGERHAMLGRPTLWHELTTGFVLATVCDVPPSESVSAATANLLSRVLTGDDPILA